MYEKRRSFYVSRDGIPKATEDPFAKRIIDIFEEHRDAFQVVEVQEDQDIMRDERVYRVIFQAHISSFALEEKPKHRRKRAEEPEKTGAPGIILGPWLDPDEEDDEATLEAETPANTSAEDEEDDEKLVDG